MVHIEMKCGGKLEREQLRTLSFLCVVSSEIVGTNWHELIRQELAVLSKIHSLHNELPGNVISSR